jgi:hypothetical protein
LQDPPKFPQIWIFGLKTSHLATLDPAEVGFSLARVQCDQMSFLKNRPKRSPTQFLSK